MQTKHSESKGELSDAQLGQAWRYVHLLVLAQALGAASPPIIISLGGVVGEKLASNPALATLPVSLYNIGLALSMIPVALLIRKLGRQRTYMMGTVFAFSGGIIAALGILNASFLIFCVGTALAGGYGACVQSYRFAVTDYMPIKQQPQAISRVMLGGLAAAIIGPQLVIYGQDLFSTPLVGSFLSQSVLAVIAFVVITRISRVTAGIPMQGIVQKLQHDQAEIEQQPPRKLMEIITSFRFIVTVFAGLVSYGLMTFMMTATPMAMMREEHSLTLATLGVQWHVLAMFAPSFFTGKLINRFGKRAITIVGLLIIACASLVSMSGTSLTTFWGGFILLGVGWNFGFIGATTLVTECYRPNERIKVQALNDTLVFSTTAISSLLAGQLYHYFGWVNLNLMTFPPIGLAILLLSAHYIYQRKGQNSQAL